MACEECVELVPGQVSDDPAVAPLAILDVALMASCAAMIASDPAAGEWGIHGENGESLPPLTILAALVIDRTTELRRLLALYRRAFDAFQAAERKRERDLQLDIPF